MASVLSYLRELNIVTMMLRILLAVLCGGLIGLCLLYTSDAADDGPPV